MQINQNKYYVDFGRQTLRHLISLTKTDEHAKGPVFSNYDSCWGGHAVTLKDIRTGEDWVGSGKQKAHKWPSNESSKRLRTKHDSRASGGMHEPDMLQLKNRSSRGTSWPLCLQKMRRCNQYRCGPHDQHPQRESPGSKYVSPGVVAVCHSSDISP